jgi:carbonic anhydrase/acetyltransferase-like protein (isoleucine patch superfamily)
MKTIIYQLGEAFNRNFLGSAYRSLGLKLYGLGRRVAGPGLVEDRLVPSLRAVGHQGSTPQLRDAAFIGPNAVVVGSVELGERSSVWYGSHLRGDKGSIRVGPGSVLQDRVVVDPSGGSTSIGSKVTIGPNTLVYSCVVESGAFVGMGATLRKGCVVKSGAIVAAGAVVTEGQMIEKNEVWAGNPAKFLREVTALERQVIREHYEELVQLADIHNEESESSLYRIIKRNQPELQQLDDEAQYENDWNTIEEYSKAGMPLTD